MLTQQRTRHAASRHARTPAPRILTRTVLRARCAPRSAYSLIASAAPDELVELGAWSALPNASGDCPLMFVGVAGLHATRGESASYYNMAEAEMVVRLVARLLNDARPERENMLLWPTDIGVITP